MINGHLSEGELQQFVLNKSECEIYIPEHIAGCETCAAGADTYRLLFTEIKDLRAAVFDFDLQALVLPQVLPSRRKQALVPVLIMLAVGVSAIPLYLFKSYLFNLFNGLSYIFVYPIIIAVMCMMIFKCVLLYRNYQRQMNSLNYS